MKIVNTQEWQMKSIKNYRKSDFEWVFLWGMVRGQCYLFGSALEGIRRVFRLPNAHAQALPDTAHSSFIRLDSTVHSFWDLPNGYDLSFDHLLSIYEWHGLFNYTTRGIPALETNITGSIDTIQIDGRSHFLEDNLIRSNALTSYIYSDGPIFGSTVLRPLVAFDANYYADERFTGIFCRIAFAK